MLLPLLLLTALPSDPPCPAWQALQRYTISAGPGAQEQFAAQELRRWLGNLTAGTVAAARHGRGGGLLAVGPTAALRAGLEPAALAGLDLDEGYVVATRGATTILSGKVNSTRGTLYAVYHFLERLGIRFFAPGDDGAHVPRGAVCPAALPRLNVTVRPPIRHRRVESWGTVAQPLFSLRSRLNGPTFAPPGKVFGPIPIAGKYAAPPGFVHTSYRLLVPSGVSPGTGPPPDLFKRHPSWFWPRGDPTVAGQLCWTNTSLVELITDNVRGFLRNDPSAEMVSVSQNDNLNYCRSKEELAVMAEVRDATISMAPSGLHSPQEGSGISLPPGGRLSIRPTPAGGESNRRRDRG